MQLEYHRAESHCFIGFCAVEKYLIKSRYLQTGHAALVPSHAPSEEQSATNTQGGIQGGVRGWGTDCHVSLSQGYHFQALHLVTCAMQMNDHNQRV